MSRRAGGVSSLLNELELQALLAGETGAGAPEAALLAAADSDSDGASNGTAQV